MLLLTRSLEAASVFQLRCYPSSFGRSPLARALSAPLMLARFALHCALRSFDVAHINVAPRGSTWRKLAFTRVAGLAGVPVILHLHGSGYDGWFGGLGGWQQARVRRFFGAADRVVVLSEHWRRFALQQLRLPRAKLSVIPNGVPAPPPALAPTDNGHPLILFAGEIGSRKGVPVLLEALARLRADQMGWRAVIAGNGAVREARDQAQRLGIADAIDFPGWLREGELDALLRRADIFVLPSTAENQPIAILEAMAHARPVIATPVGAIPEQVIDGETGLLVPPGEPAPLAAALAKLLGSPELRQSMGAAAAAHYRRNFTLERQAQAFAGLYRTLAAPRAAPAALGVEPGL